MSRADKFSGFFWFFLGVLVSIESYRLGLGTVHRPGPGFLFFYLGIFVSIMALIILARAWVTRTIETEKIFGGGTIRKAVYVLISIFLYALLMEPLGFIPVTFLLFFFVLGFVEKKPWLAALLTSVAVTVAAYLIFETALQSQLPKGIVGFLRF
jgi:putative tricarboxylic transport membrane protein